jgi:hypothetical protein
MADVRDTSRYAGKHALRACVVPIAAGEAIVVHPLGPCKPCAIK